MAIGYAVTMTERTSDDVGIRELKAHLSDLVGRVMFRDEVIWVTKNGKRVAALVPVELAEAALKARDESADS